MKTINITRYSSDINFPIIQAMPIVLEKNILKRFFKFMVYRRKWKVIKDYCLWVPMLGMWIFIPEGFIYDGASVPKILNGLYSPTGMLLLGAAPHDFGYRYEGLFKVEYNGTLSFVPYTKSELDYAFKQICSYESGMKTASSAATMTLGLAGHLGWIENRKKNCILINDFPELFVDEGVSNESTEEHTR